MALRCEREFEAGPLGAMYDKMVEEGLMSSYIVHSKITRENWIEAGSKPEVLVLGIYEDDEPIGFLMGEAFGKGPTQCLEAGGCVYREHAWRIYAATRAAMLWCFEHVDCVSIFARVPITNRHIRRVMPVVGMIELGRIPGMFWDARKERFVEGCLFVAVKESVEASMRRLEEE